MDIAHRSIFRRYGVAVLTMAIAVVFTGPLEPFLQRSIFIFFIGAVMISAVYGGFGPGMMAAVCGAIAASYFFLHDQFTVNLKDLPPLLFYFLITTMISLISEARLRAIRRAWTNEQWLSTTIRSIGDAVIATDADGRVILMNQIAQDLTGWKQEDAVGQPLVDVFDIVNEDTRKPVDTPVHKVLHDGAIVGLANHTVLIAKDGTETPIDDSAAPIRDADGEIRGVVLVFRDISERKEIERERARLLAEVENQRQRLDNLVASVPGVVWEAWGEPDMATQRIDFVSGYVEKMLGYTTAEWLATPNFWLTIVHPEDRERAAREAAAIFAGKEVGESQFRWIARDGSVRWIDAQSMVIVDDEGNPVGMRGVSVDITERKRIESELKEAKEAAEGANRAKDQFLAVLSHELRTPLTPVLATAQALESDPDLPADLHHFIEIIRRNVELEVDLIDDLLDLVRVSRGKLQLNSEPVDLHVLFRNVLEICRSEIYGKGLQLEVDLSASAHFTMGDPSRLQQVFWNLLKNAVKFTPQGGSVKVRSFNAGDGAITFEIADNGIGIEPHILPRIFNAFEQGEQTITRRYGGLGLGLAISKALVEMHDGRIVAASNGLDQGALFMVELATTAIPDRGDALTRVSDPPPSEKRGIRILLVDDHEDTKNVMKMLLERHGYDVVTAASVREGVEIGGREEFDLLISDIGLPDGNGHELMRILNERRPVKGIALSGFGMEGDIQRSREAGFVEHLTKPVTFHKLHEIIRQVTSR